LLEIFKISGRPPFQSYLFLGDYVDRGYNSIETILLLMALVVKHPNRVCLLRGNHESRYATKTYGLYDEIIRKYGTTNVWNYCMDAFDYMPLAATIDDKIFCVHGGLSPEITKINEINKIERIGEVPNDGAFCDLLWSDPDKNIEGWNYNQRGGGYVFGEDVVELFNRTNGIDLICRAHQLVMEGYEKMFDKKLVTIWSAPNYCYRCGNVASVLQLDEYLSENFIVFDSNPLDNKLNENDVIKKIDYFL